MCSAVSSKSLLQHAQSGMSARSALKFKPRRGNAFRASRQVSENSELFKKLEPGVPFLWERISSVIQPCCSVRGFEAKPTNSSRYSSFRSRERSLDPRRLRRAIQHSQTNRASPIGLHRPLGLTGGEEKSDSPFVSTLSRIGPSMQVFQQSSSSPDQAYSDPRCAYV